MTASTELEDRLSEPEEYDAPGGTAFPGRSRQQTIRTDASSGVLNESITSQTEAETPTVVRTDNRKEQTNESEGTVKFDMARLRRRVEARSKSGKGTPRAHGGEHAQGNDKDEDLEAAGISHNAQQAEQALSRLVSKADFAEMEIVGQFNLAFIIARRRHAKGKARETGGHDDLMIIESVHALGPSGGMVRAI
jgi:DNA mismatch repair protein PMS2